MFWGTACRNWSQSFALREISRERLCLWLVAHELAASSQKPAKAGLNYRLHRIPLNVSLHARATRRHGTNAQLAAELVTVRARDSRGMETSASILCIQSHQAAAAAANTKLVSITHIGLPVWCPGAACGLLRRRRTIIRCCAGGLRQFGHGMQVPARRKAAAHAKCFSLSESEGISLATRAGETQFSVAVWMRTCSSSRLLRRGRASADTRSGSRLPLDDELD